MKVSQVIARLLEIQEEYGDITVFSRNEDGDFEQVGDLEATREDGYGLDDRDADTYNGYDEDSIDEVIDDSLIAINDETETSLRKDGHWEVLIW